ncbi:Tetratricopeptide repeat [Musa troglodytarum]|uniref:Tetratricopeptide repeat n=1 Tax=Musa troglodytarum TaxID=320322 RepID=A0A9E7EFV9_9LILI|nr:Tetratricopeptide repeat [Musa troglodytarum]
METLMVDRVQSSLRLLMYSNAIFLCERLCAEFPSELNLQLLATCYLLNNQAYCAYQILKGTKMPQSRYLFAISCFRMSLLHEAEAALCLVNEPNAEVPNGAAGHYLLGLIYRFTGRRAYAIDHFTQALAIDPLLWAAYEELCALGAVEESNEYFNDVSAQRIQQQHLSDSSSHNSSTGSEYCSLPPSAAVNSVDSIPRQSKQFLANSTREISTLQQGVVFAKVQTTNSGTSNLSQFNTPSPAATQLSGVAPPPLCRNAQVFLNAASSDGSMKSNLNLAVQAPRRKFMDEGKLRKVSGRLFSDSGPRRSTRLSAEASIIANSNAPQVGGNGSNHSAKFLGGLSSSSSAKANLASSRSLTFKKGQSWIAESFEEGRRPEIFDDSRTENMATTSSSISMSADGRCLEQGKATGDLVHDSKLMSGTQELLGLLRIFGEGYRLSCIYRCQEALEVYLKLSQKQFNTGWVLSQVGRAHFELVDYFEADHFFEMARRVSPCTLEGMDTYSTVLYHLKEEMKLSYLAQELISVDRLSPQAWCALGNCYSLQKDHETALKNFQRAAHLDPRFAYAHTLCGHEYVALEDFENGIKCYQSALQADDRHYNSWYGLGVVYLRQEKFEFAEHHLRRAYNINPRSSVLMCYLGMALHSLKRNQEALEIMEQAMSADKQNPLPVYQKANILVSLERYDEALKELDQLSESAPHESSIYASMGKIYKRLEMHEKAMFYFGLALDLKPPAADVATIKAAMEKLYLPDEMDDNL